MSGMQRQVLISHATDDPEWPQDMVEGVALEIERAGIRVSLDLWHLREARGELSLPQWRDWVASSINAASHILCLISRRYAELWRINRVVRGGFGVGFESTLLIHRLHLLAQHKDARILTLRLDSRGYQWVPSDLRRNFISYVWAEDRAMLMSHLAGVPIVSSTQMSGGLIVDERHSLGTEGNDLAAGTGLSNDAVRAVGAIAHAGNFPFAIEENSIAVSDFPSPTIKPLQGKTAAAQPRRIVAPSLGASGLWVVADEWRAPGDGFPPSWASAWGDDPYGIWADLVINGEAQRMRWIEPSGPEGFWMGSSRAERGGIRDKAARDWANATECDRRRIEIREGFWLADTPCTQGLWSAVMRNNPSNFRHGFRSHERPVEQVSWTSVVKNFFPRFSGILREVGVEDYEIFLPSELQWEYAARAGSMSAYWWGDEPDDFLADWNQSRHGIPRPVKTFMPNPWGLFDVHGGVWEWCDDVWQDMLGVPFAKKDWALRVVRGGSWSDAPIRARSSFRFRWPNDGAQPNRGFRFAVRSTYVPQTTPR